MKRIKAASLSVLALALSVPIAHAAGGNKPEAVTRLGEHPAVIVARRGVQVDPSLKFYPHPARLTWTLKRPLSDGEHPAVLIARRESSSNIDPNRFILGHPAGGAPTPRLSGAGAEGSGLSPPRF
jgi:hypothetical protein